MRLSSISKTQVREAVANALYDADEHARIAIDKNTGLREQQAQFAKTLERLIYNIEVILERENASQAA